MYFISDSTVAKIVNGKIHITGGGACQIMATQIGDPTYAMAPRSPEHDSSNKSPCSS